MKINMRFDKQCSIQSLNMKEDPFSDFPIGLVILEKDKDNFLSDYQITYYNQFANHTLSIPKNKNITVFKSNLGSFKKWEVNHLTAITLRDIVFNPTHSYKEINNTFISSTSMIYVKIRYTVNKIYLCIDNYLDERKAIQENLAKSLKHQYLLTLSHELNNPLNALVNLTDERMMSLEEMTKQNEMKLLITLIKIFIENFIWFFRIMFEANMNITTELNMHLNLEFLFRKTSKRFEILFKYKNILYETDYTFLNDKIIKSNEDYLVNFIKAVFLYLYNVIPRDGGFKVNSARISNQMMRITFNNYKGDKDKEKDVSNKPDETDFNYKEEYNVNKTVQTVDMTKELLMKFSMLLGIKLKFYDINGKCLSFILPFQNDDNANDNDDEDINEQLPKPNNSHTIMPMNQIISFFPLKDRGISYLNKSFNSKTNTAVTMTTGLSDYAKAKTDKSKISNNNKIKFDMPSSPVKSHTHSVSISNNVIKESNTALDSDPFIHLSKFYIAPNAIDSFSISSETEENDIESDHDHLCASNENEVVKLNTINTHQQINNKCKLLFSPKKSAQSYSSNTQEQSTSINKTFQQIDPKRKETLEFSTKSATRATVGLCDCNDILIVDDEFFNISAIKFLLKKYNIHADSCSNGEECLKKIEKKKTCSCTKNKYKMILLDIMMPIMDGLTAAKKLQEMRDLNQIDDQLKVIVISAHIDDNLKVNLSKYPIVKGFVYKPVKRNQLGKIIEEYYYS